MDLVKKFLEQELHLDPKIYIEKFLLYEKLLFEWNKKINLISRKSLSIEEHILNSIFFLTNFKLSDKIRIADIGTGGGFPGIPLKILYPELNVLLIDSIGKKVNVLNDIIEKMNLHDINAVCGRAEKISHEEDHKHKYDTVISKSVSTLVNLYEWGINFLNQNGKMLFIKGGDIREELKSINKAFKNLQTEVIEFEFDHVYGIEEKKLVIVH